MVRRRHGMIWAAKGQTRRLPRGVTGETGRWRNTVLEYAMWVFKDITETLRDGHKHENGKQRVGCRGERTET